MRSSPTAAGTARPWSSVFAIAVSGESEPVRRAPRRIAVVVRAHPRRGVASAGVSDAARHCHGGSSAERRSGDALPIRGSPRAPFPPPDDRLLAVLVDHCQRILAARRRRAPTCGRRGLSDEILAACRAAAARIQAGPPPRSGMSARNAGASAARGRATRLRRNPAPAACEGSSPNGYLSDFPRSGGSPRFAVPHRYRPTRAPSATPSRQLDGRQAGRLPPPAASSRLRAPAAGADEKRPS
jgi:hypothetical protein